MKTLEIFGALLIDRPTLWKCTANVPAPGRDDSVHSVLFDFCYSMRFNIERNFIYKYRNTKKTTHAAFCLKASSGRKAFPT